MQLPVETAALLTLKSHVDGKNADVEIFPDRIEWARAGGLSASRLTAATFTFGASLIKTGVRKGGATEMIPVKAMTSVTSAKDGLRFYKLVVVAAGNTVEFRVDKAGAEAAKVLLTQLILGSHPSQQPPVASAPPSQAPLAPPPPPSMASADLPPPSPTFAAPSMGDRLRELASLRGEGLLTEDEYQAQKAKLLG